ncbi:hypothetical protein AAG906_041201 [Vitis piasezkii]
METPPTGVEKHEGESSILADLTTRMTQVLNHNQTQNQITSHEPATQIGIKLDGTNYALWSQIVEMYISGKDKLGYINGDFPQPLQTNPAFRKWRTENAVVKGWLINSMDPNKRLKQEGGSIETYYNNARLVERNRLSSTKSYGIRCTAIQPFPTMEQAYAQVRREDLRQSVMMMNEDTISGGAMLSRGGHKPQHQLSFQTPSNGKPNITTKPKGEGGGCTHCGNTKHTKETCFKLHGYPDWWHELKAKKKREASGGDNLGRAALMSVEPQLSLVPQQESSISTSEQIAQNDSGNQGYVFSCSKTGNHDGWIIDSGATDHMTFDPCDFSKATQPKRICIANANGVTYPGVTGAGTVALSPSFSLPNTLLVPSLSNKLLSIGQVSEELNCCALMYPNFCLFQDILTKEIIGRGTKREGLYYMDDFNYGRANNMHSTGVKERLIWLWHNRLGHPSFRYLRFDFKCEACIQLRVIGTLFNRYFQEHGLHHETSCSQTPQQNGVAERKNRHILEITRALLIRLFLHYKTPLQVLAQHVTLPSVLMLPPRKFGCVTYVHLHKNQRTKLDPCAVRCVFLGYAAHKKGYRCYDPATRRLYTTMDVTFIESENFFTSQSSRSSLQGEMISEEQNWENWPGFEETSNDIREVQPREPMAILIDQRGEVENVEHVEAEIEQQPTRVDQNGEVTEIESEQPFHDLTIPQLDQSPENIPEVQSKYPIANHISTQKLSEPLKALVHKLSADGVPDTVSEAMNNPKWIQAIEEEMKALQKNDTWALVPLPEGKKTVGCRWVFSVKHKADGSVERYKARLVAKGYTQTYGVDYQETFSPVAKLNTMRVLISLAANLDWPLHQFDIKNAFLHGDLEEESPRAWFGRFSLAMRKHGFNKVMTLIIYVDDMIIIGNDEEEISKLQEHLATEFEMKNLGGLKYFLGIEVARSKRGIFLSQRKYVLDLLSETGMLDCRPADTPVVQNHGLREFPNQTPTNKERYQRLVGKLIYLSHTRPDIAYAVSLVSQFMHCPSEDHMSAVVRILWYLKSSLGRGPMFTKNQHLHIDGYTNADWAGNITDRKSTSGYFTFVGGNLVTWRSKKQKLLWLKRLLEEIECSSQDTMNLFCDNKAAIAIAHNPVQHDRTKHVEVDRHFIKQKLEDKVIQFPFVKSEDQLADILTKVVSKNISQLT